MGHSLIPLCRSLSMTLKALVTAPGDLCTHTPSLCSFRPSDTPSSVAPQSLCISCSQCLQGPCPGLCSPQAFSSPLAASDGRSHSQSLPPSLSCHRTLLAAPPRLACPCWLLASQAAFMSSRKQGPHTAWWPWRVLVALASTYKPHHPEATRCKETEATWRTRPWSSQPGTRTVTKKLPDGSVKSAALGVSQVRPHLEHMDTLSGQS